MTYRIIVRDYYNNITSIYYTKTESEAKRKVQIQRENGSRACYERIDDDSERTTSPINNSKIYSLET
jgi:hypothetical protein